MSIIKPIYAIIENPVLKNSGNISANPTGYTNSIIQTAISLFFIGGVIYFLFHFVIAAYHMISSMGDPKKYEEALHAIRYSIIGLVIIFSVFVILKLVGAIFGITGLENLSIIWPTL